MSDSKRQQIIDALEARMRTILIANGYNTNAGAHVFDWLDRDLADLELDAIDYRDTTCLMNHDLVAAYINKLRIEITAHAKRGTGTAARLRQILADICAAIGMDDTWGGLADNTEPVENNMDVRQAEKIEGMAMITIEIEYTSEKWEL